MLYREYDAERAMFKRGRIRRFETFGTWLRKKVLAMRGQGDGVHIDLAIMAMLLSPKVKHWLSMSAYGFHSRVEDKIGPNHVTFDSGVVAAIT